MYLEIITPEQQVFEGEVHIVTFPGTDGSFQVLNNHAPMISSLAPGKIEYKNKDGAFDVLINGGTVEVLNNKVLVLAEDIVK